MYTLKNFLFLLLISLFVRKINATPYTTTGDSLVDEIEIWPGVGPGSETLTIEENIIVRSIIGTCTRDWAIEKITIPTITPVIPDNPNGAAIIICPGGAYMRVVYDVEGMDIGKWLNTIGITAFILKYRLPSDDHIDKKNVPLQDAQRAIRYVRTHAEKWGLDTTKIGIMGASAGGHVASTLAHAFDKHVYDVGDSIDYKSARPDFMVLLYPVISMEGSITHTTTKNLLIGTSASQELIDEFSAEKNVTSAFPPTYMTRAADDNAVNAENCNRLYQALQDSGIVSDLKIFDNGGHGVGICKAVGTDFENWPDYCTNWLHSIGMTEDSVEIIAVPSLGMASLKKENNEIQIKITPNPVTDHTFINYSVTIQGNVKISLFDISGKQIQVIFNEQMSPGDYTCSLNSLLRELKGLFIIRLQNENQMIEEKVYF